MPESARMLKYEGEQYVSTKDLKVFIVREFMAYMDEEKKDFSKGVQSAAFALTQALTTLENSSDEWENVNES